MTEENNNIFARIEEYVSSDDVVLFMKGNKKFPMCGFSGAVVAALSNIGVDFQDYNVLEDEELRQGIKDFTNWPTIPQLYVKGEFIGGCDIVREMYETGELQQLFKDKEVLKTA
jgi:monothiol glutaredoxin